KCFECGWIFEDLGGHLHPCRLSSGVHDTFKGFFFMSRVPFDRRHEVRNEIGTALVLIDHFAPRSLRIFVQALKIVITATGHRQCTDHCYGDQNAFPPSTPHRSPPSTVEQNAVSLHLAVMLPWA